MLIDDQGRRIATLTSPRGAASDWSPAWSPDGTRIAFTRTRDGRRSIYVMRADGSGLRRLTNGRFDDDAAWSPDGRWIAYVSTAGIRLVHPDGTGSRSVPGTGVQKPNCSEIFGTTPSWTPTGRLAFAFHAEIATDWPATCKSAAARCGWIVTTRIDGSNRTAVVRGRDAHWSPDGRTVVFTPPNGGVAIVSAGGAGRHFLGRGYMADWSADGTQIVYARMGLAARRDSIWIMNRNGSGAHRILDGAGTPTWKPA